VAHLYAASSAIDTDWVIKLVDVAPDGRVDRLGEGMIRARYRDSQAAPGPLEPDRVYEYRLDLGPVGNRFRAGHRIRIEVASASFPQFDRNMNTGGPFGVETAGVAAVQRILHDADHASRVVLPIVPA
jgi:putative CocE/NonD family hydrolase